MLLGRKIIENYPDDLPRGTPKLKSPNLTIEIDKCGLGVKRNRFSKDRASFVRTRESLTPGISPLYTPDSSHTFGRPNLTTVDSSEPSDRKGRRKRSSLAEQALANTLQSSPAESSPKEIQIQVLEQATALLSAHTIEAQESEVDLGSILERPAGEHDKRRSSRIGFKQPQQHRAAIEFESRLLRRHLHALSKTFEDARAGENNQLDKDGRHLVNLARFLQTSLAPPANSKRRPKTTNHECARGPRLRRKPPTLKRLTRSMSLDEGRFARLRSAVVRSRILDDPSKVTEPVLQAKSSDPDPSLPTIVTTPAQPAVDAEVPVEVARPRTARRRHSMDECNRDKGTITIYQTAPAYSRMDLMNEIGLQDVQIPQYAKKLIDDLGYFVDCIPLEVLTSSIGYTLLSPQSVSDSDSSSPTSESHRFASDDVDDENDEDDVVDDCDYLSQSSFGIVLSPAVSHVAPSTRQEKSSLSLFQSVLRRVRPMARSNFKAPTMGRRPSFFNLLQRAREDASATTEDCPNRGWRVRRFMFGWFRR